MVQGSGLGPILFLIAKSDLHQLLHNTDIIYHKYVDDTFIMISSAHSDIIEQEINHITSWSDRNNLILNLDKTKHICVSVKRRSRVLKKSILLNSDQR